MSSVLSGVSRRELLTWLGVAAGHSATGLAWSSDALAAEQVTLEPDEVRFLEELYRPHRVAGH